MKKTLIAAVAAMAAGPAMAADFYVPPVIVPPPAPIYYNWTGPYIGVQKGWSWARFSETLVGETYSDSAFVAGVYAGYNWSLGPNWVIGLEADYNWSNIFDDTSTFLHTVRENSFGSVRARLGHTMDRSMIYVAGGWAFGNVTLGNPSTVSQTLHGWTAGIGGEYAITQNVIGRIEYRYTNYGSRLFPIGPDHALSYHDSKLLFGVALKW